METTMKKYYYEQENYIIVSDSPESAWEYAKEQFGEDAPFSPYSFVQVEEGFVPEGVMTYFM